jgi:DNA mismatch endonuclease (patch repair protein)
MSNIRSKDTKPEKILRSALHRQGFRFRIHHKDLPGKPDIVLPKYNAIIFVHGCFWHYHKDCREGRVPSTNPAFWKEKLEKNVEKDERHRMALEKMGWRVAVVWECEVNTSDALTLTVEKLASWLKNSGEPTYTK